MRISRRIILALILGATPLATQGFAFDGAPVSPDTAIPVVSAQPGAAAALKKVIPPSSPDTSLTSLQYAAEGGYPVGAAGDDRRQRLRRAGAILSQRHSQFEDQVRSGAGEGDVLLRRVVFRQRRRAVRSGPALSQGCRLVAG